MMPTTTRCSRTNCRARCPTPGSTLRVACGRVAEEASDPESSSAPSVSGPSSAGGSSDHGSGCARRFGSGVGCGSSTVGSPRARSPAARRGGISASSDCSRRRTICDSSSSAAMRARRAMPSAWARAGELVQNRWAVCGRHRRSEPPGARNPIWIRMGRGGQSPPKIPCQSLVAALARAVEGQPFLACPAPWRGSH